MPFSWVLKPIAIASAVAFGALGVLSRRYQRARFYFNLTIYVTTLASASFWGLLISIIATAAGQVSRLPLPCADIYSGTTSTTSLHVHSIILPTL